MTESAPTPASTSVYVVVVDYSEGDCESACIGAYLDLEEAEKAGRNGIDLDPYVCEYKVSLSNISEVEILEWEEWDGPVLLECYTKDGKRVEAKAEFVGAL